jgi:hypothetical protein
MKIMFNDGLAVMSTFEKIVLGLVKKVSIKFDFIFFYHDITAYVLKHVYY